MFDKLIIYLTEKKLTFDNKKEQLNEKLYDISYSIYIFEDEIKKVYNKYLKNKVDKIKTYFKNLSIDLDEALTPLYNLIWYRSEGRIFGYIMSVIISFVFFLLLGVLTMIGLPIPTILISLIPVSLIPIDIITTTVLFTSKRIKRIYNKSLNRMKKEYGVRNNKDLVEAYKTKHKKQENQVKKEQKKDCKQKEKTIQITKQQLTDSDFLEQMLGYVSYSRYVREEDRKNFLDEINNILNKYAQLKRDNQSKQVNGYLRSDVEHLQNEYSRYVQNQERKNNSEAGYPMRFRK